MPLETYKSEIDQILELERDWRNRDSLSKARELRKNLHQKCTKEDWDQIFDVIQNDPLL